jgi:hypothetical protein
LDLAAHLLPVVSNPHATISGNSNMAAIGKTPSRYNGNGEVSGIPKWTEFAATPGDIEKWKSEEDYGICLQTRAVRAFDIDIKDRAKSDTVRCSSTSSRSAHRRSRASDVVSTMKSRSRSTMTWPTGLQKIGRFTMSDPTANYFYGVPLMESTPPIADLVQPLISQLEREGINRVISSAFTLTVQGETITITKKQPAIIWGSLTISREEVVMRRPIVRDRAPSALVQGYFTQEQLADELMPGWRDTPQPPAPLKTNTTFLGHLWRAIRGAR